MDNKHLKFEFNSIEDFYIYCEVINKNQRQVDKDNYNETINTTYTEFRGLSNEDIKKYKYGYAPGIEKLKEIEDSFMGLGKAAFKYKWDEFDGEDMSMERAYEGMPFLKQRIRTEGDKNGKFITLDIVISELASVKFEDMLFKSFSAISIVNKLESIGYRVQINCIVYTTNTGTFTGTDVTTFEVIIPIKHYSEFINLPLLLTVTSPWMFRYWVFLFFYNTFNCYSGLGRSIQIPCKDTKQRIIINNTECLNSTSTEIKIKSIMDMFGV